MGSKPVRSLPWGGGYISPSAHNGDHAQGPRPNPEKVGKRRSGRGTSVKKAELARGTVPHVPAFACKSQRLGQIGKCIKTSQSYRSRHQSRGMAILVRTDLSKTSITDSRKIAGTCNRVVRTDLSKTSITDSRKIAGNCNRVVRTDLRKTSTTDSRKIAGNCNRVGISLRRWKTNWRDNHDINNNNNDRISKALFHVKQVNTKIENACI